MQISHKAGKDGKTTWEKTSPKKRDKYGCVDGWSNQDSPIRTDTQNIQKRIREGREIEMAPPQKKNVDK